MKKLKNILLFLVILIIIFCVNFFIYIHIDELIPKHENELYTFSQSNKNEDDELIYKIFEEIEDIVNYKESLTKSEIEKIEKNEILYNIISKYIYEGEITRTDYREIISKFLHAGKLANTVYGDLEFVKSKHGYYIAYSENLQKICYYNINTNSSVYSVDSPEKDTQTKENIIRKVKNKFDGIITNTEFNPDTIMHTYKNYILRDQEKDIVVYYDSECDNIYGFCIGFGA